MVKVDNGAFLMGETIKMSIPYNKERPAHKVTLTDNYYIGKYEVTQAIWQVVMGHNPSKYKGNELPVENVSWNDCQKFISKLNNMTGRKFRLPTEAEWEYAARGGKKSRGYQYSGSNKLLAVAWYNFNADDKTHPVGTKLANELGIYDMTGNVWEWCQDYGGSYSNLPQINPTGSKSGTYRIIRGASIINHKEYCNVSIRSYDEIASDERTWNVGLRLALSE